MQILVLRWIAYSGLNVVCIANSDLWNRLYSQIDTHYICFLINYKYNTSTTVICFYISFGSCFSFTVVIERGEQDLGDIFIIMEKWKSIEWYEWMYIINNIWNIITLKANSIRKQYFDKDCYRKVLLFKDRINKSFQVHRLVAKAFIPNPENKPCVNHINWIKDDNRVENLEWCTRSENIRHAFDTWLMKNNFFIRKQPMKGKFWKYHPKSRKVNQYTKDWEFIKEWECASSVTRELWIWQSNITVCCQWKKKTAWGFIWKY